MERIILHIDMDAFFASIEQRDNLELRGKPIIVGGSTGNKGVVSTASYEARKFGVHSAMPIFQAKKLCPAGIFIKGNYHKYAFESVKIINICHTIAPIVEPVSVDEAFLDVSGSIPFFKSKRQIAETLQNKILQKLHLTCSIGIAPNKLLAKIASEMNKPSGIKIIENDEVKQLLDNLPIEKMFGIGKKTAITLKSFGVYSAGDLGRFPESILIKKFGKVGNQLSLMGKGIDNSPVVPVSKIPKPKSIGNEITLSKNIGNKEKLRKVLLQLTHKTAYRLRRKYASAHTITLKVKYDNFSVNTFNHTVEQAVNYDSEIYKIVINLFDKIRLGFRKVRLLGVRLSNLEFADDPIQLSIFSIYKKKFAIISQAVDKLKQKYGEEIINIGK